MKIVTRIAPSPTGFLHIGVARTALFNYLFSKNKGGLFLLRVEDTDKKRSTKEATDSIIAGLKWLGLEHDGEIVYQSNNLERHKQVVKELLDSGKAYKCYCSQEELTKLREEAQARGEIFKYPNIWRDKTEAEAPKNSEFAVRIKSPIEGESIINDLVQGEVKYPASELDDMVIMRADGTPTYMLAVVVDDHDMGVTNIIRGDDHLTNTFRQKVIYDALGWEMPKPSHIPLIHGDDGAKLSKRHGALGVEEYRDMGYLSEATVNYLMNLGWSFGDEEVIELEEAIKRFDLSKIGKSPSRFDFEKLNHINSIFFNSFSEDEIMDRAEFFLNSVYGKDKVQEKFQIIKKLSKDLAERSSTLVDFAEKSKFIFERLEYTEKALNMLEKGREHISEIVEVLKSISQDDWLSKNLHDKIKAYGEENNLKLGQFMPAIRAGVCGTMEAPSLDKVLESLGKDEVINRLSNL